MAFTLGRTFLQPATILALFVSNVQARRGGGRGGGIDINLDLGGPETAVFSIGIALAILTFLQFLGAFGHMKNPKRPEEDFPRRKVFGVLTILATACLTTYYALFTWIWSAENRETGYYSSELPPLAAYVFRGLMFRLKDILMYASVFILLRQRRDAFLADYRAVTMSSGAMVTSGAEMKSANSPFYRIAPLVCFGMLVVTTIVRFGIGWVQFYYPLGRSYYDTINAFQAMDHLFLVFDIFLTALLTITALVLSSSVKRIQSPSYHFYDQFVLGRITKQLVPLLVIRAVWELIMHIIVYTESIVWTVDWLGFQIATVIIDGILYFSIFYVAVSMGALPKPKEEQAAQEKAAA